MRVWLIGVVCAFALIAAACGTAPATVATIDGIEIERSRFESMHPPDYELVPDEAASTLLLVMIHDAFIAAAEEELDITLPEEETAAAYNERTRSANAVGAIETVLANRGVTTARVQLEANLDVLRSLVGPELVRREAPGFDLEKAYNEYVLDEARVCVQQILLQETVNLELIVERLNAGESFDGLAREFSLDSLAQRPAGESGAGGDMGCSYPNSFGIGLADASIDTSVPVGEPFGPVISDRGLHVVVVYERAIPELGEVRESVIASAEARQGDDLFNQWAVAILERADVTIHESYGTWGPREGTNGIPTVIPAAG